MFDEVVDHVGIYGSKGAEGLSAFNAGLVNMSFSSKEKSSRFFKLFYKLNSRSDDGSIKLLNNKIIKLFNLKNISSKEVGIRIGK